MPKFLIFDIDPLNDVITREFVFGKISSNIKKHFDDKVLIFVTRGNLKSFLPLIEQLNIERGFIVSDSGSRIFDIETKKILFQQQISLDNVRATIHYGIYENDIVVLSTENKEYVYSLNSLGISSLIKKYPGSLIHTNNFNRFLTYVKKDKVYSIILYAKDQEKTDKTYRKITTISNDWDINVHKSINAYITITEKGISKLIAIKKIMSLVQEFSNDNIYYFALNTYDEECVIAFKNHYVFQDVVLNSPLLEKGVKFNLDISSFKQTILHILKK